MYQASQSECGRDQEMARRAVRPRRPPAPRRECEPASSRGARVRSAEISLLGLAQVRRPQSPAIGALARRRTPATIARQQCQCAHFPPPQWPTTGSRRTPEPGALPVYHAEDRATRRQLRTRKPQMLLSVQRWTPESRLLRGKKAALLLDMGSVDPGCSSCGFPGYVAL